MVYEKEFRRYNFDSIVAYSGKDITEKMMDESFGVSDNFFEQRYSIKQSHIKDVVRNFGWMCLIIKDREENRIIGYSFWLPIKKEVFVEFLKEQSMLLNIEEDYCTSFNEKSLDLFQAGEAFVAGYDLDLLHRAIEDIFQEKILKLAQNGTYINSLAIEAVCDYDEKYLVSMLGLKKSVKKDKSIFYVDRYSPKTAYSRSPVAKLLQEYYR